MFSPLATTSMPDWLLPTFLGLLFGPFLLVIAAGKPDWVRFVVWAQMIFLGLMLIRSILSPLPIFGLFVVVYTVALGLLVLALAGITKIMADKTRRYVWRADARLSKQIK